MEISYIRTQIGIQGPKSVSKKQKLELEYN